MTIVERIQKLMTEKHVSSIAELERKAGLPNGQIRRWDSSTPGIDKVAKVADYFNVSLDYLMGRTDTPFLEIPKKVETIAAHIDENVTEEELEDIQKYIEFIKSQHK